jgi:hypothetical protein
MARAKKWRVPRGDASMRLQPIAFVCAHHCAPATHIRGRYVRVDATSMAEAELQNTPEARLTLVTRGWVVGVSAESAK